MFGRKPKLQIETERLSLRLPMMSDYRAWAAVRAQSSEFLEPWEPLRAPDHASRKTFTNRVYWAQRSWTRKSAAALMLVRRSDQELIGAVTLDNIRRGPAQAGSVGDWIGEPYARHGYMSEAVSGLSHFAFTHLDICRLEAACLPENTPSRGVLEKCGFKYEGVAQSYLQINGRWRNHVLYANLRADRRGRTTAG